MRVIVPFDATTPKTRLAPVLSGGERAAFAHAMLEDVVDAVRTAGGDPLVLATEVVDIDAPVTVDERALSVAVDEAVSEAGPPLAVVMADLPLATPATLERLFETEGDVVLVPGRGCGTSALVIRDADFGVDFHGASFDDHRAAAEAIGADWNACDSFRLSTDVDQPEDLVEVLCHGEGDSPQWLRDRGFGYVETDGRVELREP